MKKLTVVGVLAGLMLPLTAATEARAEGFREAELWLDNYGTSTGWRLNKHVRLMGDVDGDEQEDIIGFGEQGVLVSLSTGGGFTEPEMWVDNYSYSNGWRVEKHPRMLADVNDDDMLDIVGFGNDGVYVSLSTGSKFRPPALWASDFSVNAGWRVDRNPRMVADVNDDDRPDIIGFGDEGVYVALSTGSKFEAPMLWVQDYGYDQGWRVDKHPRLLARVNGDDRIDIVGFGNDGVLVSRSTGDRFTSPKLYIEDFGINQGWRSDRHIRLLADVSGNDKDDIVGFGQNGTLLSLARSDSYGPVKEVLGEFGYSQGWRVDRHPRLLGDIDGDEMADIVGFGQDGVTIATSRTSSFYKPQFTISDFGYEQGWRVNQHVRLLADVNDDDALDIVGFGDKGVIVALADI
jgi:hypothetical protein